MEYNVPENGIIHWPVGTGDSTTLIVDQDTFIQIDLRKMSASEDDESPQVDVVAELVKILPKQNGKPYLDVFALTHPDKDHCQGFSDLLGKVEIGELWFSPRIFRDKELGDDAKCFKKEAKRRVKETIENGSSTESGDRVLVFGFDDLLSEEDYQGLSDAFLVIPGRSISNVNCKDLSGKFRCFVHSPFKEFSEGERNDCSLGFQFEISKDDKKLKALIFGDLCFPPLQKIFETTKNSSDLEWNVFLAPHHCSKSVMYWPNEEGGEKKLQKEFLNQLEEYQLDEGYVIASSMPIPKKNAKGDNPPHALAKQRYQEIANKLFICTHEHPSKEDPNPIVFEVSAEGLQKKGRDIKKTNSTAREAVERARGKLEAPSGKVGYG